MTLHIKQIKEKVTRFVKQYGLKRRDAVNIFCVTLVAFVLSRYLVVDISNISSYISTNSDAEMSDLYNAIADKRSVRTLSKDIVIISSDECSREEIAVLFYRLGSYDIKSIGLDIFFQYPEPSDTAFISEVENLGNVVLPYMLAYEQDGSVTKICSNSFIDVHNAKTGYVNLNADDTRGVIRSYRTSVHDANSTYNSFAATIAATGNTSCSNYANADSVKRIYFPSIQFDIVSGADLLSDNINDSLFQEKFNGKYIIIGDTKNSKDVFLTPVEKEMPGVEVHAHILNTIINGLSPQETPEWLCWLIAILICFVFTTLNVWIDKMNSKIKGIVMRFCQILMLYVFIILGVNLFVNNNIYTDFSPTMLMLFFGLISNDIWVGGCEIVRLIIKKYKSK